MDMKMEIEMENEYLVRLGIEWGMQQFIRSTGQCNSYLFF